MMRRLGDILDLEERGRSARLARDRRARVRQPQGDAGRRLLRPRRREGRRARSCRRGAGEGRGRGRRGARARGSRARALVRVADARSALAHAAARFFPRQPETIVAVTGTSGKTSVAAFARQIWQALGQDSASLGTIGVVSPPDDRLRVADDAGSDRAASRLSIGSPRPASPIWLWRPPRTALTRSASTACASRPGPSPI